MNRLGARAVGALLVAIGLNALQQVPGELPGLSAEPTVLWVFQLAVGLSGVGGGLAAWLGKPWAWKLALACAVSCGATIAVLGPVLSLDAEERAWLPLTGLAVSVVLAGLAAYLRAEARARA
ncbi:MAG: hypothetical protein U0228_05025 [Myxococcaceae bacterium]